MFTSDKIWEETRIIHLALIYGRKDLYDELYSKSLSDERLKEIANEINNMVFPRSINKYFTLFFICPHCGSPRVSAEKLAEYINEGALYCGKCGKVIANALAEALHSTMPNVTKNK